jgi:hypothetical protein
MNLTLLTVALAISSAGVLASGLAATSAGPVIVPTDAGIFIVQSGTARSYENAAGVIQVDAVVDLSTEAGVSRHRVGVSGCSDGRGFIARVQDDGAPASTPSAWFAGGQRALDALARIICEAAAPQAQPQPGQRMI